MSKVAKVSSITNTKVYQVLENFSKIELNRLRKFIASPYFNASEALLVLFDALCDLARDLKSGRRMAAPDQEHLWKLLEPRHPFDSVRMRKYLSDLNQLVQQFIEFEEYSSDKLIRQKYFLSALVARKIEKFKEQAIRETSTLKKETLVKDGDYHLASFELEKVLYELQEFTYKRGEKTNLEEMNHELDVFYFSTKLKLYTEILSRYNFTKHEYKLPFIDSILNAVKTDPYDHNTYLNIYYLITLTLLYPENLEHYYALKVQIKLISGRLKTIERENVYNSVFNYCTAKINQGNSDFYRECFELYCDYLSEKQLFPDGNLSPWFFKNITTVALNCNELAWVENFIEEYANYIPAEYRENAVSYNKAALFMYKKEYGKVLELLQSVEYEDIKYAIDSKWMMMRTYYEIGEYEALLSLSDSFRIFLQRRKDLPEARKQNYIDLINMVKRLVRVLPGDTKAIEHLKNLIQSKPKLINKKWLLDKLAALE